MTPAAHLIACNALTNDVDPASDGCQSAPELLVAGALASR